MAQSIPRDTFRNGYPIAGDELIEYVKARTDTVLLSFSAGKDSLAAWVRLRPHFNVVPVYCWRIPHMTFVDRGLAYYEKVFGTKIIRIPHPSWFRMMNEKVFQPPERYKAIDAWGLPEPNYDTLFKYVIESYDLPKDTWVATGVRSVDNPNRHSAIKKYGPTRPDRDPKVFFPVWDMRKAELVNELNRAGVKLLPEYRYFGRSFDGLTLMFLKPIRDRYPEDYARILEWFPLAAFENFRYDASLEHTEAGWTMSRPPVEQPFDRAAFLARIQEVTA